MDANKSESDRSSQETPRPNPEPNSPITDDYNPGDIAAYDSKCVEEIYDNTEKLKRYRIFCEQVVIAAYKISEVVPDFINHEYVKFWKDHVIPNLVDGLVQDTKARSTMTHAFGSIGELAIIIKNSAEIIRETTASPQSILIAQRNIPAALSKLECYKIEISSLSNAAIMALASRKEKIFEIIGSQIVDVVEEKGNIEIKLSQLYEQQKDIISKLGKKQGDLIRYNFLMSATERQIFGATEEKEQSAARIKELKKLNSQIEQLIEELPGEDMQKESGFLSWTTSQFKDDPQKREQETRYYISIIKTRNDRIKEELGEAEAEAKIEKDLTDSLDEYKCQYQEIKSDFDSFNKAAQKEMAELQAEIDVLCERRDYINSLHINISGMSSSYSKMLLECLATIKTFFHWYSTETMQTTMKSYEPLIIILQKIINIVEDDVGLLSKSDRDIFLAVARLEKSVAFLKDYSKNLFEILQLSDDYPSTKN